MKRIFLIAGVEHEGRDGRYAIADDCFDVMATPSGLWLIHPNGDEIKLPYGENDALRDLWEELREVGESELSRPSR